MFDPLIIAGVGLVTGAGSGIGRSVTLHFAERGCKKLFLVDLSLEALQQTKALVLSAFPEVEVAVNEGNVAEETSVQAFVNKCIAVFGRLDFACNNAGIGMANIATTETEVELFNKVHAVNSRGVFLCQKYEIFAMLEQEPLAVANVNRIIRGSIVNTASLVGLASIGRMSSYHSSKHAAVSMTRVDARHYADKGIRVNCICPGFVKTPMMTDSNLSEAFLEKASAQCPMKRLVDPDEVAEAILFLHGSGASAITGVSLPIDGGALLFH